MVSAHGQNLYTLSKLNSGWNSMDFTILYICNFLIRHKNTEYFFQLLAYYSINRPNSI